MHPNPAFAWTDEAAMRRFVADRGFAHLCIADGGRPLVAHLPVTVEPTGSLRFHIARANRIAASLAGRTAIASVAGVDCYVSPDWYGMPDQVPTWNYVAVEVEGRLRPLDRDALVEQIDRLDADFEARLAPKPPWHRRKLASARFEAMLDALDAYELVPSEWRGTAKLGQNKPPAARRAVADALSAIGRPDAADAMRTGTPA